MLKRRLKFTYELKYAKTVMSETLQISSVASRKSVFKQSFFNLMSSLLMYNLTEETFNLTNLNIILMNSAMKSSLFIIFIK